LTYLFTQSNALISFPVPKFSVLCTVLESYGNFPDSPMCRITTFPSRHDCRLSWRHRYALDL